MTRSNSERVVLVSLTVPYNNSSSKQQGQELQQGRNLKDRTRCLGQGGMLVLACFTGLAQPAFLEPTGGLTHNALGPPTSVIN